MFTDNVTNLILFGLVNGLRGRYWAYSCTVLLCTTAKYAPSLEAHLNKWTANSQICSPQSRVLVQHTINVLKQLWFEFAFITVQLL